MDMDKSRQQVQQCPMTKAAVTSPNESDVVSVKAETDKLFASGPSVKVGEDPAYQDDSAPMTLTSVEGVIVKDTWNKLLAFHELMLEMFYERLLYKEPALLEIFNGAHDELPRYFGEFFDWAVRATNPETEIILRESYKSLPGNSGPACSTAAEFLDRFTYLGMLPRHWLLARVTWMWMLHEIPYLEEYEKDDLRRGDKSAAFRFFSLAVLQPALDNVQRYDSALSESVISNMAVCGAALATQSRVVGTAFYRLLFRRSPEVVGYFGRTDMEYLTGHLFEAIAFLIRTLQGGDPALESLRRLALVHTELLIPPEAYQAVAAPMIEVMRKYYPLLDDRLEQGWLALLKRVTFTLAHPMRRREQLLRSARQWLDLIAAEQEWPSATHARRWSEITREVNATGSYTHTYEELSYGAQVAWRNAPKCIARVAWRNLVVRDLRHITQPDDMFREICEHIRLGVNGGNMQIVMNVFRPKRPDERWGPRIWNSQYLRYAGYRQGDGSVIGDGANVKLTKAIERLGWKPPEPKGSYDLLPLVIEIPGEQPRLYTFSDSDITQVSIEHPTIPEFGSLGLKWVVIPAISNFTLDIGGINYGCAPFSGWFMETEIARNLWENSRYDKAEHIARVLGLDTSSEQSLWRDRAFLELNVAILHSFAKARVSLVDHQTAAKQFLVHDLREKKAGRECPAQWSWVVPAAGGSTTPIWHHEMRDFYLSPSYHYAADRWAVVDDTEDISVATPVGGTHGEVLILYGSETGTAEAMARQTARRLYSCRPTVLSLNECDPRTIPKGSIVLIIASTFGEGALPGNATLFGKRIQELEQGSLSRLRYAVLALGSTVYAHFCAAGRMLDRELCRLGADRIVALHRADEIKGQFRTFEIWSEVVGRLLKVSSSDCLAPKPRLGVVFCPSSSKKVLTSVSDNRPGYDASVISNRELIDQVIPGSRSTRFLAFAIDASINYETGDHLLVYPKNSEREVEKLCKRLNVPITGWFMTTLQAPGGGLVEGETPYPEPAEVKRVLTDELDLSLKEPVTELLKCMADNESSIDEERTLRSWVDELVDLEAPERARKRLQTLASQYGSISELLEVFPSARLGMEHLIDTLPRQRPRLYSIASSPLAYPHEIHVTVGVVQFETAAGRTQQGLCSSYLAGLDPSRGDAARIAVKASTFHPPADLDAPMLMVGPGTGLSPLIGFLQHRGAQIAEIKNEGEVGQPGEARLYFGCRNVHDYLYRRDLEAWRDSGLISHLAVAFSRASESKEYVQHLIAEQASEIWQILSKPDSHYYICGDAKMADDVFSTLMTVAQQEGQLTRIAAVNFFDKMKHERRYHADVWGVTFNFEQAIEQMRELRYTRGKQWLLTTEPTGE